MMRVDDRIIAAPRSTLGQALTYAGQFLFPTGDSDIFDYLTEVYRVAPLVGVDTCIVVSQSVHETSEGGMPWNSVWWNQRLNPAGLGITGDPAQNLQSPTFESGTDAAQAHVAHLLVYALGPTTAKEVWARAVGSWLPGVDPRYEAYLDAYGNVAKAETIAELAGTWATDPDYDTKIVARSRSVYPDLPDQSSGGAPVADIVFGQVKHPKFVDRLIPDHENGAWDDLGPRNPYGVCQHSMIGTLLGTDGWFRRGNQSNGGTDYGIGNDTDGALDGVIYRWNDPTGVAHPGVHANRSGWANGGSDGLEGDGALYVRTLGTNAINRNLVSIERSDGGNTNHPMSAKQFDAIVKLTAYWFDWAKVPYDRYPMNPAVGVVTHMIHKEFATKDCPFPPVYNRIDELQDAIRGVLKAGQTHTDGAPIPPVVPPEPDHDAFPNGWTEAQLTARFGKLTRVSDDGTTKEFGFDSDGPISNAWVQRGADEEMTKVTQLPRPLTWHEIEADANQHVGLIVFDRYWTLYRPTATTAWRWVR